MSMSIRQIHPCSWVGFEDGTLSTQMLHAQERAAEAKHPDEKVRLQRHSQATDREIDHLVYNLYGITQLEIASLEEKGENALDDNVEASLSRPSRFGPEAPPLAEAAQQPSEGGSDAPSSTPRARRRVHGVRERTGDYGSPQEPTQESEAESGQVGSTRYFDTAEGTLSYTQVAERLAVALVGVLDEILQSRPEDIAVTTDWLCECHRALAATLFPEWAGRYRNVNVRVGAHTPPPFNEVPVFTRLFCDDLAERLRHVRPREEDPSRLAELLAWADWRFQWIHPFRDFNGRIGRVLLAVVLYTLALPHVQTAPVEPAARQQYLAALRAADAGDLTPLTRLWIDRLAEAL